MAKVLFNPLPLRIDSIKSYDNNILNFYDTTYGVMDHVVRKAEELGINEINIEINFSVVDINLRVPVEDHERIAHELTKGYKI